VKLWHWWVREVQEAWGCAQWVFIGVLIIGAVGMCGYQLGKLWWR
jgi:hypothetical protein